MSAPPRFGVRFWGVRGTVPVPGATTLRYGGNTACVELRLGQSRVILDMGTGIRALGLACLGEAEPLHSHILLSHTHVDHINGFAFFKPAYHAESHIELWNGHLARQGRRLGDVLASFMQTPFFPVPLDIMHATMRFHDFDAGEELALVEGASTRTATLNHPGGATAYRIDFAGRAVCYLTDHEHDPDGLDQRLVELVRGADLVIYDSTYTDAEYPRFRGWGHSTWQEGVRLCRAAGAARLATFHHDPCRDDAALDRIAEELERALPGSLVAREGVEILL